MDIQTTPLNKDQDIIEFTLKGRLDMQSSDTVKDELHKIIATQVSRVIINVSDAAANFTG